MTKPIVKAVQLTEVHVGDTVTRMLGGTIPMRLKVTRENERFVYCATPDGADEYTFERESGVECDVGLRWGSEFGITGSLIAEIKKGP
ncbi:hypothetical protein [Variovorax sp. J22R115]|uniref:hypothetical protein n=1 Tax=Variovorax sp. J22R115 TaxID=3053509 RepID=UPI002575037C|nr:hypothetical protein [Variovorax sp. J22R115]MDM0053817.1 hypothetical protein [Variovorax sp. J22R115]